MNSLYEAGERNAKRLGLNSIGFLGKYIVSSTIKNNKVIFAHHEITADKLIKEKSGFEDSDQAIQSATREIFFDELSTSSILLLNNVFVEISIVRREESLIKGLHYTFETLKSGEPKTRVELFEVNDIDKLTRTGPGVWELKTIDWDADGEELTYFIKTLKIVPNDLF